MSNYITVDGGTTNTRLRLVKNHSIVAEVRVSMGAKDCIFENNVYKNLLAEKIKELLMEAKTEESEIRAVIISGMLTSELGLYNVPHVSAPVGIRELHNAMRCEKIGICSIPCYFIPGVKIVSENIWQSDMMRGEETEFFGLSERLGNSSVCIMPGSQ